MASSGGSRVAVGATYAAQGFGYATAVTSLPGLKDRVGIDDATVSIVILLCCLTAAGGSVMAERLAVRRGSHVSLLTGLTLQAIGLPLVALSTSPGMLMASFALYGIGLGTVDASSAMQGVQLQQRLGTAVLSTLFACATGASIAAALVMSGLATLGTANGAIASLVVAAVIIASIVLGVRGRLVPALEPAEDSLGATKSPLPTAGIWLFGSLIMVAYVADSAVSTWSSVYLHDNLAAGPVIAPLGYAAYQAAILLTRLVGDRLVAHSRARLLVPTVIVAILGLIGVSLLGNAVAVVAAFAFVGVGVGTLVPLTFSAAGDLAPEQVHQVIARINLFNYVGAVLGAVALGLLSAWPGLGPAFLLPAILLLPALLFARRFDRPGARPEPVPEPV
ncbi:putative MFS family arabinose efflux permease [Propionicimonas paludicola]|uniref:Putative MFS family arabinose efflux permease n=1 Tax=Propionicimonas paludicola TaxID=185243 RepID=A0A2A9CVW5_9ACTN|nr:MFS transporter [Propionicimonas paludicola]PFG18286.1 putative MFS family arabinose efflux permease [Propionicimonas paludicola]